MRARCHLRISFADGGDRSDPGGVHPIVACGVLSLISPTAYQQQISIPGGAGRRGYLIRASSI